MTTDARPWNSCERCGFLLLHFDDLFSREACPASPDAANESHKLSWSNRDRLPFGAMPKLRIEEA